MRSVLTLGGLLPLALLPLQSFAQPILLEDIVVSANRAESLAARTGSSVSVLTGDEIAASGETFTLGALGRLPGVTTQQNGSVGSVSGFSVRGAGQRYVRVLVDGIDIGDPTGVQVAPSLSGLLAADASRIEVLKGSQSALYGGQTAGGVINITSARPGRDGVSQAARLEGGRYGTANGAYTLGVRTARADGALTLSGLRTDGFSAAEAADGNEEADGYETARVSATGTFYATDALSLFGTLFHQYERGEFDAAGGPGGDDPDNYYRTRSTGALAGVDLRTGRVDNRLSVSRFDIERDSFSFGSLFETEGARSRVEYLGGAAVSPALALQFGADWSREETRFEQTDDSSIAGAFGQATFAPLDALTLTAALRRDEHSEFGGYTTGRLTAAWLVTPDTTLRGSAGAGFRAPSNFELFDPSSGNAGLEPETSVSWDLGVERRFADGRGEVTAAIFRLEIDELIDYVGEFLPPDFACTGPCAYVQVPGASTAKGFELGGSYAVTDRWRVTGAYTYTDAADPDGARRNRIPRHDLSLGVAGRITERIDLGVSGKYAADVVDTSTGLAPGQFDGVGDYTVVDARLGYRVTESAEAYLRVENLFDEEYQTARGFGTAGRSVFAGVAARF